MTRVCKFLIVYLICQSGIYSQSINDLESELFVYESGESYESKLPIAHQILVFDSLNTSAINHIVEYEIAKKGKETFQQYFENLKRRYPDISKVYELKFSNIRHITDDFQNGEYEQNQLSVLFEWTKVFPRDAKAIFYLSEIYYDDYIGLPVSDFFGTVNDKKGYEPVITNSGVEAFECLKELWNLDSTYHRLLYYPINQISCLLNKGEDFLISRDNESCHVSWEEVLNVDESWPCDKYNNYLFDAQSAIGTQDFIEWHFNSIEEPCRSKYISDSAQRYLRFSWFPSFDPVIVCSVVLYKNNSVIYLREGKGLGGYEPKGLKRLKDKRINKRTTAELIHYLTDSGVDTLKGNEYYPMTDGASYYVESWDRDNNLISSYETNRPNDDLKRLFIYLFENLGNLKTDIESY